MGVTDESTGSAEPVTVDGDTPPRSTRRRLRLLLSVAAVVLALDVVTKVLAVRLLTPGQPVSIIGDTVTDPVRNPCRVRWPPATQAADSRHQW